MYRNRFFLSVFQFNDERIWLLVYLLSLILNIYRSDPFTKNMSLRDTLFEIEINAQEFYLIRTSIVKSQVIYK